MLHVFTPRIALLACLALAAPAAAQHTRVTAALPTQQPDGMNGAGVLSANGRFVAFESEASNLVTGDTNGVTDVFLFDRQTEATSRISVWRGSSRSAKLRAGHQRRRHHRRLRLGVHPAQPRY
jgi:hypothetical protein